MKSRKFGLNGIAFCGIGNLDQELVWDLFTKLYSTRRRVE
jgi:hypothetical protein